MHENHGSTSRSDLRAAARAFKTALRSVSSVEDVIVVIHTDTGAVGYGEAPPTGVITGDTTGAIIGAIRDHIAKTIIGRDVDDFEDLMIALNACIQKNTSAKAAVDMALWDLYGQLYKIPVYKLMGGAKKSIVTDITISVNDPEEMVRDALKDINPDLPTDWDGYNYVVLEYKTTTAQRFQLGFEKEIFINNFESRMEK